VRYEKKVGFAFLAIDFNLTQKFGSSTCVL